MIVDNGWVTCEDIRNREDELDVRGIYKVVCYNAEMNLVYLEHNLEPFDAMRFLEYWQ
jgi:hypothetical protein